MYADKPKLIGMEVKALANLIKRRLDNGPLMDSTNCPTGMQGMIMGFLANNQHMDLFQRDVETVFNIRRSTATGIIKLMERNGFITRESVNYDERLKKLTLTPKAVMIHEQITAHLTELETLMVEGLTKDEIDTFFHVVGVMKNNIA